MKEKITSYEFLILMFLVPYGTASLFFMASDTKNDVWIALIFYSLVSIPIQMIYISLFNKYPNDSPVTYLPKIFGKYIGFILSILYIWFFAYDASRDLRDFIELTASFSLIRLPMYITGAVFVTAIIYNVYKGIENIGNMAQIAFLIVAFSSFCILLLAYITDPNIRIQSILPIIHSGFVSLVTSGWKLSMFPYGEFVVMTMFYPFVLQRSKLRKAVIFSSILEGLFLAVNNILFIVTLGFEFANTNDYPLLETLRWIHIGDFLNRLDIIFLVVLTLGGFFKISILIYAAALGIEQLFNFKHWGILCSILGVLILITSLIMARDNPEHLNIGWNIGLKYIFPQFVILIPLAALITHYIKLFLQKKNRNYE
ncbi:spore germination protein KB [Clostridium pasteurianum DSM 525 = ATCC 6013]|uniref:Spore germination protein n=1 Tax=Clostridium pasteurianum DSM 525 = ATCC 6013 TaxID=1262449 RepID=A0A0H3J072_CLOPA|nr:GerAB/ArcD/ProY family transporter [Clostridium pasteurianum]AJA46724.1 spore germination protein KB [Clostridium pasteurianum DSM 525 = ATCC 6013]AJA50712.1 spore germination protein KB [Clostridium pasteurianum DSM 525 = ATCC 6013]AOZ74125.1 spore gernimation protein [Clostridium pasteurianum DSM 525 = ATCC 6013]AOZ77922.1 spore gernimation protein [Clostridium pasteurianum]ELP61291.1 spore germination protein KB [Clostridium pasteurianum DSM 525 = ATCC 6013]